MNILLTGVAGFIGSNLLNLLLENGHYVLGIDNFTLGKKEYISKKFKNKNFDFINLSINDTKLKKEISQKIKNKEINEIWHLAASSDILRGVKNPKFDHKNTFLTTMKIGEIARDFNVKKIIFSSTGAVYGDHNERLYEDKTLTKPISSYGTFKLASENLLRTLHNDFLNTVVIFRFSNVVGPNYTHGVILDLINKAKQNKHLMVLGDGNQQKPYIHVKDLISGIYKLSTQINDTYEIINLGPKDAGVKVKYIAEKIVQKFDREIDIVYENKKFGWLGDIPKYEFDTKKALKYGFEPNLTSKEAIDKAINEIFQENL